jgi:hypothetical protein
LKLFVHDLASGAAQQVTDGAWDDFSPTWSPDGTSIAFASNRTKDNVDIYVLDVATREARRVTTDPGNEMYPAWSADGRIYFNSDRTKAWEVYSGSTAQACVRDRRSHAMMISVVLPRPAAGVHGKRDEQGPLPPASFLRAAQARLHPGGRRADRRRSSGGVGRLPGPTAARHPRPHRRGGAERQDPPRRSGGASGEFVPVDDAARPFSRSSSAGPSKARQLRRSSRRGEVDTLRRVDAAGFATPAVVDRVSSCASRPAAIPTELRRAFRMQAPLFPDDAAAGLSWRQVCGRGDL